MMTKRNDCSESIMPRILVEMKSCILITSYNHLICVQWVSKVTVLHEHEDEIFDGIE